MKHDENEHRTETQIMQEIISDINALVDLLEHRFSLMAPHIRELNRIHRTVIRGILRISFNFDGERLNRIFEEGIRNYEIERQLEGRK